MIHVPNFLKKIHGHFYFAAPVLSIYRFLFLSVACMILKVVFIL